MADSILKTDYDAAKAAVTTLINKINSEAGISWSWSTIGVANLVSPKVGDKIDDAAVNALNDGIEKVWAAGISAVSGCPTFNAADYQGQNAADKTHNGTKWGTHYSDAHSSYKSGYDSGYHTKWCSSRKSSYNSVMNSGRSY